MKLKLKWRHVKGSVYESINGWRIHISGMVRAPSGETFHAQQTEFYKFMKMTGDNRKRSLMACAESANKHR
jgi:hypothetical protein